MSAYAAYHTYGHRVPVSGPVSEDEAPPRLVIVSHDFSESQTSYQEARIVPGQPSIFYKDATPRVEHFLRCTVALEGAHYGVHVPVRLTMCYEDGTEVSAQDGTCLKILGDGRKQLVVPPEGSASFYYRFELGSFRRADRKFSVKIVPDAPHVAHIARAVTPGVLVLSKKKLEADHPAVAAEAAANSRKRKHDDGSPHNSDDEWHGDEKRQLLAATSKILDRVTTLEQTVSKLVDALAQANGAHPLLANSITRDHSRSASFDEPPAPVSRPESPPRPEHAAPTHRDVSHQLARIIRHSTSAAESGKHHATAYA